MTERADASSLAAEAYAVVKRRILSGELTLGQVISRRKIAAELGMSFLPVTEALLRLEFEGLLESRPRAGTRVRIPSYEDVRGHYVLREALEVQAAVLFTEVATDADRAELRTLAARVDALSTNEDRAQFVVLHSRLHQRIADGARCRALSEVIAKSHALASTWRCATRRPTADDPPRWHEELVDALTSGNPDRATDAVRRHVALAMELTLEQLRPYFELRKSAGNTFSRRQPPHAVPESLSVRGRGRSGAARSASAAARGERAAGHTRSH